MSDLYLRHLYKQAADIIETANIAFVVVGSELSASLGEYLSVNHHARDVQQHSHRALENNPALYYGVWLRAWNYVRSYSRSKANRSAETATRRESSDNTNEKEVQDDDDDEEDVKFVPEILQLLKQWSERYWSTEMCEQWRPTWTSWKEDTLSRLNIHPVNGTAPSDTAIPGPCFFFTSGSDALLRRADIPSTDIYEPFGSVFYWQCVDRCCNKLFELPSTYKFQVEAETEYLRTAATGQTAMAAATTSAETAELERYRSDSVHTSSSINLNIETPRRTKLQPINAPSIQPTPRYDTTDSNSSSTALPAPAGIPGAANATPAPSPNAHTPPPMQLDSPTPLTPTDAVRTTDATNATTTTKTAAATTTTTTTTPADPPMGFSPELANAAPKCPHCGCPARPSVYHGDEDDTWLHNDSAYRRFLQWMEVSTDMNETEGNNLVILEIGTDANEHLPRHYSEMLLNDTFDRGAWLIRISKSDAYNPHNQPFTISIKADPVAALKELESLLA